MKINIKLQLFCIVMILGDQSMAIANRWKNWAGNQTCKAKIITPKNNQELAEIIKKAKEENKKVRAYGTSHSWSNIVCTDGYLINTDKLNKILAVDLNKKEVRVQAGIKIKDLNRKLEKLNLCLSNQGAISKQSIAGAISTATHGSGKTGTLASFITKVQLLCADGKLRNFSKEENSEQFDAVRTSIGSLGIMTELTIECEPLFKLERTNLTLNWAEFIKSYEILLKKNDYIEFYWYISEDNIEAKIHNRVNNNKKIVNKKIDYSYKLLSGELNEIYFEEEIAIERSKFVKAANSLRELLKKENKTNKMFDEVLFRFVSSEKNNLLSPASDQDVVYFSITTTHKTGYEKFFKKFYNLMLKFNGRPHWGKINFLTNKDAKKLYSKNFEKFIKIRKKLDPNELFANKFTEKIFF